MKLFNAPRQPCQCALFVMLHLHIHGLTHGRDTDNLGHVSLCMCIMSLSAGSCSYHIRVMSATDRRTKFVRVDYFETVTITDMDKCPYQICIASVSCLPCIRVVLVSRPWHILAIHTRIWQGCDTRQSDTTQTPYRGNTDEGWQRRTNNHGCGFDTNVARIGHEFHADNANATRMRYGHDKDSTCNSIYKVLLTTAFEMGIPISVRHIYFGTGLW